jgi:hypothetical protein
MRFVEIRYIIPLLLIFGCTKNPSPNFSGNAHKVSYGIIIRDPDRRVERTFDSEQDAIEYIDRYKDNHAYTYEKLN